ncbi:MULTISPECIES: type III secretion system needle filament subunit SctF [Yersinia]|uniref:type III secretion system needle filament subunit SctF n=1 Tax=Yersinia TaxID=629 RepID=UPI0005E3673A|nr:MULTISPECIES: type III secretion system needle filament subunit SctF [Yersinia]OVZ95771.1 EscF/YscF/HrpA family type III secretion system needle major subunit [Yersinia frederiksenii]RXA94354.1 type III secretion system needle protein SsaG [Yersinia sp. 2105 StPb PI]CNI63329.1 secretion system apparatus protein [Yersinia frederiksenii]CNJ24946.1 secretion system apparatus protein [Yersinia frederiksenii]CNK66674.1 secretion system apparatus protein [Yersinia frederiksenii]
MDINALMNVLTQSINKMGQDFQSQMVSGNPSDPEHMLKMQFAMQQYSSYINFSSALMKNIKDMTSGIIAKI